VIEKSEKGAAQQSFRHPALTELALAEMSVEP
jgi:hypothetical protein